MELESPAVTHSDEQGAKEAQQKRIEARDEVVKRIVSVKRQLEEQTLRAAMMSNELERRQLDVTRAQRRLDELDRLNMQAEFPQEMAPTTKAAPTDQFQQTVSHELEQLHREIGKLQAENAELMKQTQRRTQASPAKDRGGTGKVFRPGDQVVVRLVSKTSNELAKIITVDTDGKISWALTLDLTGRGFPSFDMKGLNIAGLDEKQAANAIRKSIGQTNAWQEIRVERVDGAGATLIPLKAR